jgi:hypothetical protein
MNNKKPDRLRQTNHLPAWTSADMTALLFLHPADSP